MKPQMRSRSHPASPSPQSDPLSWAIAPNTRGVPDRGDVRNGVQTRCVTAGVGPVAAASVLPEVLSSETFSSLATNARLLPAEWPVGLGLGGAQPGGVAVARVVGRGSRLCGSPSALNQASCANKRGQGWERRKGGASCSPCPSQPRLGPTPEPLPRAFDAVHRPPYPSHRPVPQSGRPPPPRAPPPSLAASRADRRQCTSSPPSSL